MPLPPTLTSVQALDTKTLMITWTTQGDHDYVLLTATYNDTTNEEKTQKLTCRMLFTFCLVDVLGVPGQKLLIQGYTTLGQRQSSPYSTYHSTIPPPKSEGQRRFQYPNMQGSRKGSPVLVQFFLFFLGGGG